MRTNANPIELKSAEDEQDATALVTKALDGLTNDVNAKLAKVTTDLAVVQAKLNRPGAANDNAPTNDNSPIEAKAFNTYVRKGREALSADEIKTMTVAVDAAGGFLAPTAFGAEIFKALRQFSPIRQYARVTPIGSSEIKYPRRVSSTAAAWVSEIADRSESELTYEQVTLTPYELATYVDISAQLLEDNTYNLEGELARDLAETFAITEGLAFVSGNGLGKPTGLLTATGITEVKTGYATDFKAANPADTLIGMFHKLPGVFAQAGAWVMNRNTLSTVRQFKDLQGRYIVLDGLADGAPVTLLGRPIVEAVDMPDIGAGTYPIVFGDMSGYRIVDRVGMSILRDPYSLAAKGQIRVHCRMRVGADCTNPDRFIKLKVSA